VLSHLGEVLRPLDPRERGVPGVGPQRGRDVGEFAHRLRVRAEAELAAVLAERYKGKLVVDTVVYRGGDMLSAWAFTGLTGLGLGLSAIAACGIPVALAWGAVARFLGLRATAARSDAR
jgi:ATP:ADP antiporter, AAA family